ncbi:MAG: aromatic ring-hydroxylating dioxygenase subunit alpha [Pseudomonadota bacterium]
MLDQGDRKAAALDLPQDVAAELAAICENPDQRPRSMAPSFYFDPRVLAAEENSVFLSGWVCVGRWDEVKEPGDFFTTEIVGEPLIIARGADGEVRALSNVCRHRGSKLVDGTGTTKRFSCPYHAWAYGLDGALVRAPLIEGDLSDCNLPVFATEEWMGWIFVNLDGSAQPLTELLADLDPYVRNYHPEELQSYNPSTEGWGVNWKGLAENFMEGYHLTPVHLKTLHPMTPTRLCEKVPGGGAWTVYKAHYNENFEGRTEVHPDMTPEECRISMMFWVYPGLVVGLGPNTATFMSLLPDGPDRVRVKWDNIYRPGMSEEGAKMRYDFAASFNAEDKARLEDMQIGLHSRWATGGPLAPADYEGTIWDFYQWIAHRLMGEAS